MCGGVAVSKRGSICGMVEGIVPKDHPQEILRNLGVIIDAPDILRFGNPHRPPPLVLHSLCFSFLSKVEEIQKDPENVPSTNDVSLLICSESVEILKDNTNPAELEKYSDPLKVLHNTLFPEDMKYEKNDSSHSNPLDK